MKKPSSTPSPRLVSLDILRGFDLFLLVFFQPVLWTLAHQLNLPWLNSILFQFDHEVWEGFRFWDLVMPLFLFMTGASMPFSFSKFKDNPDKGPVYRKIIKRFILLFIFGMIVQGNLLYSTRNICTYTQHPSSHCHRLSDCRHHTVALQLPLAADRHSPAISDLLDTDDLPGRLHSGRKLCREGGQAGTGAFPRRSVLE